MALSFLWMNNLKKLKGVSKKELEAAIKKLEKKILTNEESINTAIDMITSNELKITELENNVTTLKNNVNSFIDEQLKINTHNATEIQSIKNDISVTNQNIKVLTENVKNLTEKVDSYEEFKNNQLAFNNQISRVISPDNVKAEHDNLSIKFQDRKIPLFTNIKSVTLTVTDDGINYFDARFSVLTQWPYEDSRDIQLSSNSLLRIINGGDEMRITWYINGKKRLIRKVIAVNAEGYLYNENI